ncbi:FAD binding domain-containing protein [Deinococcus cellulosilyticus]|uniref:Xanthine dehydrogenase, N-terminal subunit n=1 Tax=Deinococcus cellulosilyticus (strain DSM 18568 / NBRC 106333 / KACC 11606 / 5516J-15) TaxID=1223518 RepID=A0A511NBD3_DEIC1|nr:FAD binding domain-containing protein [Deinococcus cellulosilyticus]GEM50083.1 xanthine dehydrogenase, N-terminal subunit [Deinococcus cellulosilyticus NBRC 106333 = KACC 11606]
MKEGSFPVSPQNRSSVTLRVNGSEHVLNPEHLTLPLLHTLRGLGFTSCKEGCGEGECGACAVVLRSASAQGSPYTPLNACLTLTGSVVDYDVLTAEGLHQHPVQSAMVNFNGSQCGYCTPGFVMSMFSEYYRERPFDLEAISGNLCRCTGYRAIRDAALSLPAPEQDAFSQLAVPEVQTLAADRFYRPTSLRDALLWLNQNPDARVLAGGTDAIVEYNQRDVRPERYLDVNLIPELNALLRTETGHRVGAAVTLSELESIVPEQLKKDWLDRYASRLIRNRATLGGSLVTASPIGDAAPLLLALDASVAIATLDGEKKVSLSEFFTGYRATLLKPGELLQAIEFADFPQTLHFFKVTKRHHDDISSVAIALDIQQNQGVISSARIGLGGVAATPIRAREAEERMVGKKPLDALKDALDILEATLHPISDHRASSEYRKQVTLKIIGHYFEEHLGVMA